MTENQLDRAAWKILKEEQAMLNRKVYLLDRAQLAHDVFVVLYAPEAIEFRDSLIQQTRVVLSINGKSLYSGVVDSTSRSISEIVETHATREARHAR